MGKRNKGAAADAPTGAARKSRLMSYEPRYALNAICPYFTMFPLEYPMRAFASAAIAILQIADRLRSFLRARD